MTRQQKRWLCWGPALAIAAIYGTLLVVQWTGGIGTLPPGVNTIVIVTVLVLANTGQYAGKMLVVIRDDVPRRQEAELPQYDTTDLKRAYAEGMVDSLSEATAVPNLRSVPPQR